MILSVICLLVIVLMTMYMATQGFLTSALLLISALFASMLAMGVYEPLTPMLPFLRSDYGAGLVFLGVFLVAFAVIRIVSDSVVPKNIKLHPMIDKAAGGGIGIIAAFVIIGTTLTGIEMLPVPESIGGTPKIQEKQEVGVGNRLVAEDLVTALYYTASGNALGGKPLEIDHPKLGAELIGYRHTVAPGSRTSMDPSLVTADFWSPVSPERGKAVDIKPSGNKMSPVTIVVRTEVLKGSEAPKTSFDTTDKGEMLLLTPTQVRLVTADEKGNRKQYYPTGLVEQGRSFKALPLSTGYTIDDYAADKVVQEWVFEIDDGQTPQFIEIKRGGRASLLDKKAEKEPAALARNAYPPHAWQANAASLTVSVKINGTPVIGALVVRLVQQVPKGKVTGLIGAIDAAIGTGGENVDRNMLIRMKNADNKEMLNWTDLIRLAMEAKAKGAGIPGLWDYIQGDFKHAMTESETVKSEAQTDTQGEVESKNVATGSYVLFVAAKNDQALRVWAKDFTWDAGEKAAGKNPNLQQEFDAQPLIEIKASGK